MVLPMDAAGCELEHRASHLEHSVLCHAVQWWISIGQPITRRCLFTGTQAVTINNIHTVMLLGVRCERHQK